jgi:DNA-binding NarL/FixJ family response regulator
LLAADHSLILLGIRSLLEHFCDVVGQVEDGRGLIDAARRLRPDLIILDVGVPHLNGIDAARQIRQEWPQAKLLFLTMHTSPLRMQEAFGAGGSGYLLKTSATDELRTAIDRVLKGQIYIAAAFGADALQRVLNTRHRPAGPLTARQREVLQLIAEGSANKQIAATLNVSVETVEFHRGRIMTKLGVHNTAELSAFAVRNHLLPE